MQDRLGDVETLRVVDPTCTGEARIGGLLSCAVPLVATGAGTLEQTPAVRVFAIDIATGCGDVRGRDRLRCRIDNDRILALAGRHGTQPRHQGRGVLRLEELQAVRHGLAHRPHRGRVPVGVTGAQVLGQGVVAPLADTVVRVRGDVPG